MLNFGSGSPDCFWIWICLQRFAQQIVVVGNSHSAVEGHVIAFDAAFDYFDQIRLIGRLLRRNDRAAKAATGFGGQLL